MIQAKDAVAAVHEAKDAGTSTTATISPSQITKDIQTSNSSQMTMEIRESSHESVMDLEFKQNSLKFFSRPIRQERNVISALLDPQRDCIADLVVFATERISPDLTKYLKVPLTSRKL